MTDLTNEIESVFSLVFGLPKPLNPAEMKRERLARWDSLAHVNLIAALESQFDLFIDVDHARELDSLESVVAFVRSQSLI